MADLNLVSMTKGRENRRHNIRDVDEEDDQQAFAKWLLELKASFDTWVVGGQVKNEEEDKMSSLAALIRTFRDPEEEEDPEEDKVWVDRSRFEIVAYFLVLLNTLIISLETDYSGLNGRGAGWVIAEVIFCVLAVLEVSLKMWYHSVRWLFLDGWNLPTALIALLLVINVCVVRPVTGGGMLRLVSLIRICDLLKLGKNPKLHKRLEELQLIIQGLQDSFRALAWTVVLAAIFIYIWSVLLTKQIGHNADVYRDYTKMSGGWNHEEFFGTVGRSMYTLFQCMTLDGWSSQIARHITDNQGAMAGFFIGFLLLTSFGLLNIAISIMVENMLAASLHNQTKLRVREERARRAELESVREIFLISDTDGSGSIDLKEFTKAMENPEVQWRMRQLELPAADAAKLFGVMDGDGSRTLSIDEFLKGCTKLKGPAQSRDMLAVQAQADTLTRKMDYLASSLEESERLMGALHETTTRIRRRFESAVDASRRKLAHHVGGSKPIVPPGRVGPAGPKVPLSVGNQPVLPQFPDLLR